MYEVVVFFFKQKTAYELRISDWSSDVCSSDLPALPAALDLPLDEVVLVLAGDARALQRLRRAIFVAQRHQAGHFGFGDRDFLAPEIEIGRASCRERVCQYV